MNNNNDDYFKISKELYEFQWNMIPYSSFKQSHLLNDSTSKFISKKIYYPVDNEFHFVHLLMHDALVDFTDFIRLN